MKQKFTPLQFPILRADIPVETECDSAPTLEMFEAPSRQPQNPPARLMRINL